MSPDLILIATGSEVSVAVAARGFLAARGLTARVVSMPSVEAFARQPDTYQKEVLLDGPRRVAIEAGATGLWWKYVGLDGAVVGIDTFGESAPAKDLFEHFGMTAGRVADIAAALIKA